MQPYHEGEDIEHYLITFERIAHACQWPQEEWALHLAPLLTGKARSAYVAMDIDDTMDYGKIKCAVLQKFEIGAETYRVRFRSSVPGEDETPKELQVRLKDLYDKWMTPKTKTKEQIGDIIVMEQFLKGLNPELRTWIKERNPETSREAAELAEAFLAARRPPKDYLPANPRPPTSSSKPVGNELRSRPTRHSTTFSNSDSHHSSRGHEDSSEPIHKGTSNSNDNNQKKDYLNERSRDFSGKNDKVADPSDSQKNPLTSVYPHRNGEDNQSVDTSSRTRPGSPSGVTPVHRRPGVGVNGIDRLVWNSGGRQITKK